MFTYTATFKCRVEGVVYMHKCGIYMIDLHDQQKSKKCTTEEICGFSVEKLIMSIYARNDLSIIGND